MNTFCQTELVDTGLQPSLQEVFHFQGEHVIEPHAGLVEDTDSDKTTNERISFKQTSGVFFIKCEKLTPGVSAAFSVGVYTLTGQRVGFWTA